MRLAAIRRYPVKAMAGEALASVPVEVRGLAGDRGYAVVDADGRFAAGKDARRFRRREGIFDYAAQTTGGLVQISRAGHTWSLGEPALEADLREHLGASVSVRPEGEVSHFDAAPISVIGTATLAALTELSGQPADQRRFRANLLIQTEVPWVEETWQRLRIGEVELDFVQRVERCRVIDLDQDGAGPAPGMLRTLGAHRELCAAAYFEVLTPGVLTTGTEVTTLDR